MGIHIEDGAGSGKLTKVDSNNRLEVKAINVSSDEDINKRTEKVWSIPFEDLNPAGDDDYVVYIQNTGDAVLQITDIRVSATAATQIELHAVSGAASGGANISAVSRTVGSAAVPTATIQSGTDITGLTNDGILFLIDIATANDTFQLKTSSRVRIPKGKAVALLVETGTANISGVISLVEENGD
ncbi:MAG: hypothetical protein Unbinned5081contig1002_60 [Prokaryotic dsDNA virus sp.]|nr:MAG: hypothetical protein Unbinned5081contig1002_60 [Prokaryotic dsDNA virus sp.]|tara:strand:+ start:13615 stop:14169 length:555 start_codon:yes stop_codon:yes gene_type:complete